jgi:tRNA pseudouridine38-40 synthase
MPRFKVLIEYEGTRYSGWQIQKNARTVQGEFHRAIAEGFQTKKFELYGAGRTDAGVHAVAQVAHLDVITKLTPKLIQYALNDHLPADVNVLKVEKAALDFHARHSAVARSYVYQISKRRTAFGKKYVWWIRDILDVNAMRAASELFVGKKDFASFTADDPEEKSTSVLIERFEIVEADDLILARIIGSHFLWKMVRQIVGILAEVGRSKISEADVQRMFTTPSNKPAEFTAPPSGLFLERVYYAGDAFPNELTPLFPV